MHWIDTAEELKKISKELSAEKIIALDTEFIRESTFFPHIALVQVASASKAWIIDVVKLTKDELAPLFKVFQDQNILKVLHAAQADQECLYNSFGVIASPSFDTAEAASLVGLGSNKSLQSLLEDVLHVKIQKGHARSNWLERPLPQRLQEYALADVDHLVALAQKLISKLEKLDRYQQALVLSQKWENYELFISNPTKIAERLAKSGKVDQRGFALLTELIAWRENQAISHNIPRKRVADDGTLLDVARTKPKTIKQLGLLRGLQKQFLRKEGEILLGIIETAEHLAKADLPTLPERKRNAEKNSQLADIISCAVKLLAKRHRIASQHLISKEAIDELSGIKNPNLKILLSKKILSPENAKLIGEDLLSLLSGKTVLMIDKGKAVLKRI
ncbi:MAG: hypothetical protein COX62_01475 [Deltaproteobacteria bacterium CG_4_10_14_0_2_um_filter_43_8]|nr:MAG: hypothetical protein COV43_00535 [Deltaproteobacteria bacterium CG11_big_fil_rev_8_21_14_0_20_42_23]PJA21758.1 MAG: hypothetical protein COX62_01475 [Deltaproteobacteria bacterium CG_4_10_14_0_2_um_filter_43_8]PJC63855.1 MAG: hypothetical protein CO021_07325 [Deltaproteobacteria bacterium CG_4_9_14_0_2_um_filter_42_21]